MSTRCGLPDHRRHWRTRSFDGDLARGPWCTSILLAGRTPLPPRSEWDDRASIRGCVIESRPSANWNAAVSPSTYSPVDIGSARRCARHADQARSRRGAADTRDHPCGRRHPRRTAGMRVGRSDARGDVAENRGAQVLDEAFPSGSIDFFFLTSSAAAVFGVAGQGSYAAANAYLDALARARNRQAVTAQPRLGGLAGARLRRRRPIVAEELQRLGSRELAAG